MIVQLSIVQILLDCKSNIEDSQSSKLQFTQITNPERFSAFRLTLANNYFYLYFVVVWGNMGKKFFVNYPLN